MTRHPRTLVVELAGEDHGRAVMAHRERQLVEISGTVVRSGRSYRFAAESPLTIVDLG